MVEAKKLSAADFSFMGILGRGAYGRVAKATKKDTGEIFAIKIVDKKHLQREGKTSQALVEKNILARLKDHPGTVRLFYTFQDIDNLYFVLEYCPNGDFLSLISSFSSNMPVVLVRFYTAELVNILDLMFKKAVVHRDLKPENLLMSESYHLKLSDFGTAKDLNVQGARDRAHTFVGTAECFQYRYVSPEVLSDQEAGIGVDLWALGCVVYQMLVGRPPFQGMSQYLIFEKIRLGQIEFPQDIDLQGKDFIEKLLVQDPDLRLGCGPIGSDNDLDALREHPFISSISHSDIFNLPVPWENWPEKPKPGSEGSESDDDDIEVKLLNMSGIEKDPKQEESKKNLKPEPMILVSGVIKKKCGWFYKKRYLIVSSEPRIYYTDANNLQKVREIALSKDLVAELKHGNDFVINNPQRSYFFREMIGNPERWVEGINNIIKANFGE